MRLRRDSLLIKIIFYNDIAIVLTSLMIAFILVLITFKDMDSGVKKTVREKTYLLERYYNYHTEKLTQDMERVTNSNGLNSQISEITNREEYQKLAKEVREYLDEQNYKSFNNTLISLVGMDGNILGESVKDKGTDYLSPTKSQDYLNYLKDNKTNKETIYKEVINNKIIIRLLMPNITRNQLSGLVVSFNLEEGFLKETEEILGLNIDKTDINKSANGIFFLSKDNIIRGEIFGSGVQVPLDFKIVDLKKGTQFKEIQIKRETYNIGVLPILGGAGNVIAGIGVAVSMTELTQMKAIILLLIISICIGLILFNSAIFGKIFYNMLNPLVEIADVSNRIAKGEKCVDLKISGSGEVRTLVKSFKRMVNTIDKKEADLRDRNGKLQENLNRIDVIEKLLMRIYGKDDIFDVIKIIIQALTSEMGLGYSRGVFLRYSREVESLIGEYAIVNNRVVRESVDDKETIGAFRFQKESLNEIISYIKISVRKSSLLSEALLQKKIIYYNDKSYKYNLGNELLQSLGLVNFIVLPIYGSNRDYGCIILDNFTKEREITPEEVELLNLLILNLGTHFKNRSLEEEKLENERALTIGKLSEKFLGGREQLLSKVSELITEAKEDPKSVADKLIALEGELMNIKREDSILSEYSDVKIYDREVFSLEELLNEIYLETKNSIKNRGISISLFVKYSGKVYGDRKELKKSFVEILNNAVDSVVTNEKTVKKINIILSKGKNTEKIRIRIVDNGIGMSELQLQNIEEPFVSYKRDSAGLGLSIAFRIIKHHQGIIKFISSVGKGTEVKITLNDYKEENK